MDKEILLDNKKYFSSRYAGKVAGYTNDYVARLCRQKKINGKLIGRIWYVEKDSFHNFLDRNKTDKLERNKYLSKKRVGDYKYSEQGRKTQEAFRTFSSYALKAPMIVRSKTFKKMTALVVATTLIFGGYFFKDSEFAKASYAQVSNSIARAVNKLKDVDVKELAELSARKIKYATDDTGRSVYKKINKTQTSIEKSSKKIILLVSGDRDEWILLERDVKYLTYTATDSVGEFANILFLQTKLTAKSFTSFLYNDIQNLVVNTLISTSAIVSDVARDTVDIAQNVARVSAGKTIDITARIIHITVNETAYKILSWFKKTQIDTNIVQIDTDEIQIDIESEEEKIVQRTVINQPVIERIIETEKIITISGISNAEVEEKLQQLSNRLSSEIYRLSSTNATNIINNYQTIALTNKIDKLGNVIISNSTISGTLSGLTDAHIPDNITITGYVAASGGTFTGALINTTTATSTFSGGLTVSVLNVSTTTATSTFANGLELTGGCFSINGVCVSGSGGGGSSGGEWATTTDNLVLYPSIQSHVIVVGSNATTTTGNILEVVGNTLLGGIATTTGKLSSYSFIEAPYFNATSTTATSTIAGGLAIATSGFVYDYSSGNVGIGTAAPRNSLQLSRDGSTTDFASYTYSDTNWHSPRFRFYRGRGTSGSPTTVQDGDEIFSINSFGYDGSTFSGVASISVSVDGTVSSGIVPGHIVFSTKDTSGNYATRMMIKPDGNIGIGTTSPYAKLSVVGPVVAEYFVATSTTASSTIAWGLNVLAINQTGNATSTFNQGIDLTNGCFSVNGTCISGGGASAINGLTDVTITSVAYGDQLQFTGSVWENIATSSLAIALTNTTGTLAVNRGGTNLTTYTINQLLYASGAGTIAQIATSSLGLLTTNVAEGTNFYATQSRWDSFWNASTTLNSVTTLLSLTDTITTNSTTTNSTSTNAYSSSLIAGNATTTNLFSTTASSTNLFTSNFSIASLSGFLKATAGAVATALIDLTADITGILGVGNGGTGWGDITANTILLGNGTSQLATTTAGTDGYVLALESGTPVWVATTTLSTISGTLAVNRGGTNLTTYTINQLLYASSAGTIAQIATSSLGLLTTNVAEGSNLYYTDARVNSYIHASTTISKTYTANTFTGTNIFNGTFTIGSINGPLQANNGVVSATTSVGILYGGTGATSFTANQLLSYDGSTLISTTTLYADVGGTGFTSYTIGDILYADTTGTLTRLGIGSNGEVLKLASGIPTWGSDITGGGGGAGLWATSTVADLLIRPNDTNDIVVIGATGTSTTGNILEVVGNTLLGGIATTTGKLSSYSFIEAPYFNATSTTATSTIAGGLAIATSGFVYDYSSGNVGIGTASPDKTLVVQGPTDGSNKIVLRSSSNALITLGDIGSGANRQRGLLRLFDTGVVVAQVGTDVGALTFFNGGNVGIGTTTPTALLTVGSTTPTNLLASDYYNSLYVSGALETGSTATSTFSGGLNVLAINQTGNATSTFNQGIDLTNGCFSIGGTCVGGGGGGGAFTSAGGLTTLSTITDNVGIGTSTPYSKLTVWADSASGASIFEAVNSASTTIFSILDNSVFTYGAAATSTIQDGQNYAWSLATSSTAGPLFVIDTSGALSTSTFNTGFSINSGALVYDIGANETSIENLNLGPQSFVVDAGTVSWINLPVTASPAAGTVESYSAQIDSTSILTIYAEANSSGGIQNSAVGIGTTSPFEMLAVAGNGYFDGNLTMSNLTATGTLTFSGLGTDMILSTDSSGNLTTTSTPQFGAIFATSTTATSTFAGGLAINTSGFVYDYSSNNVGIGTASPDNKLEVLDASNNAQLRLTSSDSSIYTDFQVAASTGDLTIRLSGASANDIIFATAVSGGSATGVNLWVCDGSACPSLTLTDGGNLIVERDIKYPSTGANSVKRSIILTAAGAIVPASGGAAKTQVDGTNHSYYVLDFDASSDKAAYWHWVMPDSYDTNDTLIDITYYWEAGATSGATIWCFQAKGLSANNAEDIDPSLSSAVCELDTAQGNANDLASTTESAAASNFDTGEYVIFKVFRDANSSSGFGTDDMTGDARLLKVKIEYSVSQESD